MHLIRRIFVEKKKYYNIESQHLLYDLKKNLNIEGLISVRLLNRYDIKNITLENFNKAVQLIFSDPTVDIVYKENFKLDNDERIFAIEYLPGQYDQRKDSTEQCIQILTQGEKPLIKNAKVIVLKGEISDDEFLRIKKYCINPIDSQEASLEKPNNFDFQIDYKSHIDFINGFIDMSELQLKNFKDKLGFAMSFEDLEFCMSYFKNIEKRNPTITELRVIDTYWSDHCRHTTFSSELKNIEILNGKYSIPIKNAYKKYLKTRSELYNNDENKKICLMDIATIGMKELRAHGLLNDLDVSDENNAYSIVMPVDVNGKLEKWMIMFKNETHNHPTEIEPFGGAATCLGGAIRDPLSGRAYVYQAMRITGSGDPRVPVESTLDGKLPQRKITVDAARGFSSYGNQIGLSTGKVKEIYDDGYIAKRMEIGAVVGAVPMKNVDRKKPVKGDVIILLGGRTGRDGCGGATGSSKAHTKESILTCGAEVQKGNPITERKIQRLFRNEQITRIIKKCNDFGAGGVSVAIGELCEGLIINLDLIPKKYDGLDGTELAISESQERMAILVDPRDAEYFIKMAHEENLEATIVAKVTSDKRIKMTWKGNTIVDLSREFLNTNGIISKRDVTVGSPYEKSYFEMAYKRIRSKNTKEAWLENLINLNICSQEGLSNMFDSTIGAGTILLPYGGLYQDTPSEGMAAKIPIINGDTKTCTLMSFGFDPNLFKWSPFHGAIYSIVEAISKIVAMGGDYKRIRLSLQEYFEKLEDDKVRWGKPFSALLGAFYAQEMLEIPAIGGKDSMSGTFMGMDVPPTIVAFALDVSESDIIISPEFKCAGDTVILVEAKRDNEEIPIFDEINKNFSKVNKLIRNKAILSAAAIKLGGIAECITKMTFGNRIGFKFDNNFDKKDLFTPSYGSIVVEINDKNIIKEELNGIDYIILGKTIKEKVIYINDEKINIEEAYNVWSKPLESIFPTKINVQDEKIPTINYDNRICKKSSSLIAKPRVLIPVFPGTNCEYDSIKAFQKAGAVVDTQIFKNLNIDDIKNSLDEFAKAIKNSQIIMIPGGFSAGDEPDGSGKFISTVFRNPKIKDSIMDFLNNRDGLILGICNGFQALIKTGLLPFGEIRDIKPNYPTLSYNTIGRHVSRMIMTRITSTLSPWFNNVKCGEIHVIPVSHGEGRFIAENDMLNMLRDNGQIAAQYVDINGNPTMEMPYNPNGSIWAIEAITSPDGRILGKMGHSERIGLNVAKNIPGNKDQKIFEAGVSYFK